MNTCLRSLLKSSAQKCTLFKVDFLVNPNPDIMKTYNLAYALIALVVLLSCSKSDESSGGDNEERIDADYAVILNKGNEFSTQFLNVDNETLMYNTSQNKAVGNLKPEISFAKGSKFLQYFETGSCSGTFSLYDFSNDVSKEITPFDDLTDCNLNVYTITTHNNSYYMGYELTMSAIQKDYYVRIFDENLEVSTAVDIPVSQKPFDMAFVNNRIFLVTFDELISNQYTLVVIDLSSNTVVQEMNLGNSVRRIFASNSDVIISYDELHTKLNSNDMSFEYIQYQEGTEPNFAMSTSRQTDVQGRLYFPFRFDILTSEISEAGVYNFSNELLTVYSFENILSENQRETEFDIETATAVGYDPANNLILIGYKKANAIDKGGLILIKPAPDASFVGNIDLDGIPFELFIQ